MVCIYNKIPTANYMVLILFHWYQEFPNIILDPITQIWYYLNLQHWRINVINWIYFDFWVAYVNLNPITLQKDDFFLKTLLRIEDMKNLTFLSEISEYCYNEKCK